MLNQYPKNLKVGIILTISDVYQRSLPDFPAQMGSYWRKLLEEHKPDNVDMFFPGVAYNEQLVSDHVKECEASNCNLLIVLPMAYAPSGASVPALVGSKLPLMIIESCRDLELSYGIDGLDLLANQAVHGVQDLTNVLCRRGRRFHLVAGHPLQEQFQLKMQWGIKAALAARVLQKGRVGRVGLPFDGMLDFSFDSDVASERLGFQVVPISPNSFIEAAENSNQEDVDEIIDWAMAKFDVSKELTLKELRLMGSYASAIKQLVTVQSLDGIAINFLPLVENGAQTMPFLGADMLMAAGYGYGGEGDVMVAVLSAALAKLAGECTFTEMFCPDFSRNELLLSHMGECNYDLANPDKPVKIMARDFYWGGCQRVAVPVFQLKPGKVTLVNLSEISSADKHGEKSFQLLCLRAEVLDAPVHVNLRNPYTRITFHKDLAKVLENYSMAGGGHHLVLVYDDYTDQIATLAKLCQIEYKCLEG